MHGHLNVKFIFEETVLKMKLERTTSDMTYWLQNDDGFGTVEVTSTRVTSHWIQSTWRFMQLPNKAKKISCM